MQNALLTELPNDQSSSTESMSRYIQLDGWIFEVKNIKAKRIKEKGKPHDAVANLCVNGAQANVDGYMSLNGEGFSQKDHQAFMTLLKQLDIAEVQFDT